MSKISRFPAGINGGGLVVLKSRGARLQPCCYKCLGNEQLLSNEHEVVKVVELTLTASVPELITPFVTLLLKGFK